jgi:hypothetical protein
MTELCVQRHCMSASLSKSIGTDKPASYRQFKNSGHDKCLTNLGPQLEE